MAAASCWSRAAVVAAGADAVDDVEDEAGDEDGDAQAPESAHALAALAPKLAAEVVLAEVAAAIALLSGGHANDNDERLMDMGVSPGGRAVVAANPMPAGALRAPARSCVLAGHVAPRWQELPGRKCPWHGSGRAPGGAMPSAAVAAPERVGRPGASWIVTIIGRERCNSLLEFRV
ncbi:MAG TPA: hypothetical protein VNE67_11570 [Acetobacteraceae bacterium]|nr:hypothetical protein [Acetobacteraceae bacterium]